MPLLSKHSCEGSCKASVTPEIFRKTISVIHGRVNRQGIYPEFHLVTHGVNDRNTIAKKSAVNRFSFEADFKLLLQSVCHFPEKPHRRVVPA